MLVGSPVGGIWQAWLWTLVMFAAFVGVPHVADNTTRHQSSLSHYLLGLELPYSKAGSTYTLTRFFEMWSVIMLQTLKFATY